MTHQTYTPNTLHIPTHHTVERAETSSHRTITPSLKRLGYSRKQREVILANKLELRQQR